MKSLLTLALFFSSYQAMAETADIADMKDYTFTIQRAGRRSTAILLCSESALKKLTAVDHWSPDKKPDHYQRRVIVFSTTIKEMDKFINEAQGEGCILKPPNDKLE